MNNKFVPEHYLVGGIESIDVMRAKMTPEQFRGFCIGNALKYLHRFNHKGEPKETAKKIVDYATWLLESYDD